MIPTQQKFEKFTFFDAFPTNIFKNKKRHRNDDFHVEFPLQQETTPNLCFEFYSNDNQINENKKKKNYYEIHPFYSLFYLNNKKEEESEEEEKNNDEIEKDEVEEKIRKEKNIQQAINSNVILDEWENNIIWDNESVNENEKKESIIFNNNYFYENFNKTFNENNEHNSIEEIEPNIEKSIWKINDPQKEKIKILHQKMNENWSLFPIENDLLENEQWENEICWDENDVNKRKPVPLYLDLNDNGLLLKEAVIPLQNKENEEKNVNNEDHENKNEENENEIKMEEDIKETKKEEKNKNNKKEKKEKNKETKENENKKDEKENEKSKKKKERKIWKIEDERLEDNISNDRFYYMGKTGYTQKKFIIYHSVPAVRLETFQTHFTIKDLRNFHRPKLGKKEFENLTIEAVNIKIQQKKYHKNNTYIPQSMKDLSSKDGIINLIEYIEENPMLLSEVGMGSRIRNYVKRNDEESASKFKTGEMVVVERGEQSPFLGKLTTGLAVQSLDNKMTKTPIHETRIKSTDFLLIRSKDGLNWSVREIDHLFVATQQHPQREVEIPLPGSKAESNYHRDRLYVAMMLKFKQQSTINQSELMENYPTQNGQLIKKILKNKGKIKKGVCELNSDYEIETEEELFSLLTPERICYYESMLAGKLRLQDKNIELYKYEELVSRRSSIEPELRKKIEPLLEEIRKAPWTFITILVKEMKGNLSSDYVIKEEEPMYLINFHRKSTQKPTSTVLDQEIKKRYGDLRKMRKPELKNALRRAGCPEDKIKNSRWDLVDELQNITARSLGIQLDKNQNKNSHSSHSKNDKELKEVFRKQIEFIQDEEEYEDDEDDEDKLLFEENKRKFKEQLFEIERRENEKKKNDEMNFVIPKLKQRGKLTVLTKIEDYQTSNDKNEIKEPKPKIKRPHGKYTKDGRLAKKRGRKPKIPDFKNLVEEDQELEIKQLELNEQNEVVSMSSSLNNSSNPSNNLNLNEQEIHNIIDTNLKQKGTRGRKKGSRNKKTIQNLRLNSIQLNLMDEDEMKEKEEMEKQQREKELKEEEEKKKLANLSNNSTSLLNLLNTSNEFNGNDIQTKIKNVTSTKSNTNNSDYKNDFNFTNNDMYDRNSYSSDSDEEEYESYDNEPVNPSNTVEFAIRDTQKIKQILESCMEFLYKNSIIFSVFIEEVRYDFITDYLDIIEKPMCLKNIEQNIRKNKYQKIEDFVLDIELIVNNCYKYNSRGLFKSPLLFPYADLLYEYTISFLQKYKI